MPHSESTNPILLSCCCAIIAQLAVMSGCGHGLPALRPPDVDPDSAAAKAMEQYDKDGDGLLSATELEACPGLAKMVKEYDTDGDSSVSQAELAERLRKFAESGAALTPLTVDVRLNNLPLAGATVRFVPEDYFDDEIKVAVGKTSKSGTARMAVASEDLPENQRNLRAVQFGTYRVEITHPNVDIPARYNTETTLGYETIFGQPKVEFRLTHSRRAKK